MFKPFLLGAALIGLVACGSRHTARRLVDPSQDAVLVSRTPEFAEVTVDAGTMLSLTLDNAIASNVNHVLDSVQARLSQAVVVDNIPVLPRGSLVDGVVSDVQRSGPVDGLGRLAVRFYKLVVNDTTYEIATTGLARVTPAGKATDAVKGAAPVVSAAGTGYVLTTPGKDVRLRPGERLSVRLARPVTIRVPVDVT